MSLKYSFIFLLLYRCYQNLIIWASDSHVHFSRITSLTGCTATATTATTCYYYYTTNIATLRYIEETDHQSEHMTRSFRKYRPQNEFSTTKTRSHRFTLLCMWAHRKSGAKHTYISNEKANRKILGDIERNQQHRKNYAYTRISWPQNKFSPTERITLNSLTTNPKSPVKHNTYEFLW